MKNIEEKSNIIKEPMDVKAAQSKRNPFLTPAYLSGAVSGLAISGLGYYATTRDYFATLIFVSLLIVSSSILILLFTLKYYKDK